ncbi:Alpha/Beta hydrolase protein [Mycena rosella]|uniref:feruloyl esterase n=1 Tax=Mycena rosella TaxID=1033263 RepID=A0AAD7D018_MYCRO|nr:Alpha/Beta hydrolase protein [Mycena rosella]
MLLKYTSLLIFLSPVLVLSSGCNSTVSWTFDSSGHSNQTLGNRSFLVHIPAEYNPTTTPAYPVVLSFHGYGKDDQHQEDITGFSTDGYVIDGKGIIAVYPLAAYGLGKHKKPVRVWAGASYSPQDVDDFEFVNQIIDSLQPNLCIDPKRIYASGISNGGGFVNLLACTPVMVVKFAAFAPVAAALYPGTHPFTDCTPGRKIPLINIHGTDDDTVPYDGSSDTTNPAGPSASFFLMPRAPNVKVSFSIDDLPSIPAWIDAWVVRNGCDAGAPTDVSEPYDDVVETTWQCGVTNDTMVKAFVIEGGTHRWPTADHSFDATPE